jgi:hypothetical protein
MEKLRGASITNAAAWAVAIFASAAVLRGTGRAALVGAILGGAAGASIIVLDGAVREIRRQGRPSRRADDRTG